jgi:AcrR family transcriptional regulator
MNLLAERRLEEKERRRADILDAAMSVALQHGLADVTMDLVARQARLSRALIYVYFRDRDELLFGLCQRALTLLRERFETAMAAAPLGVDKARACGTAYLAFARELPVEFEVLSRFEAHTPDIANMAVNESACMLAGDEVHKLLVDAIELGVRDGSIRQDLAPAAVVAVTLWGFMHGVLQLAQTKANVLAHEGVVVDQLLQNALDMARRSIASAATIAQGVP